MEPHASMRDTCWTDSVYPPSDDSFALVDALLKRVRQKRPPPSLCLEVGCGSGFVCVSLALMLKAWGHSSFHILATDVNPEAAECTRMTARRHGVEEVLDVVVTHFWEGLSEPAVTSNIDLLLFNPPYVPTPDAEMTRVGLEAAWAGGRNGRRVIDEFLTRIPPLLQSSPHLEILLVVIDANRPSEIIASLKMQGYLVEVILNRRADEELLSVLSIRSRHINL